MRIYVKNVISSFKLNCSIDLQNIYDSYPENSEYSESVFNYNVVVFRNINPKMTFLIYKTGTVISTGATSIIDATKSYDIFSNIMNAIIDDLSLHRGHQIDNIVATCGLEFEIDLLNTYLELSDERFQYEPEQFPGLIYRSTLPKGTISIFPKGKLVMTGSKSISSIKIILLDLLGLLKYIEINTNIEVVQ